MSPQQLVDHLAVLLQQDELPDRKVVDLIKNQFQRRKAALSAELTPAERETLEIHESRLEDLFTTFKERDRKRQELLEQQYKENKEKREALLGRFEQLFKGNEEGQDFAKLKLTQYWSQDEDQVLAFGRGDLLFVFNFHPTQSHTDYRLPVPAGSYHIVLDSDAAVFGGYELVDDQLEHLTQPLPEEQQAELPSGLEELSLYLPSRVALVLRRK